jgi:diamine N-acetyltransferase
VPVVVVRPAVRADAPAIVEIYRAAFPASCPPGTPPEVIDAHLTREADAELVEEQICGECFEVFVGSTGGAIAGFATAELVVASEQPRTIVLLKLYVGAEARGTGLAAGLLRAVLDAGRVRGALHARLGISGNNARAIRFYAKTGFRPAGSRRFLLGDDLRDDLTMALNL